MGNPNLSADAQPPHRSLAALIGTGDSDALAEFRDAHAQQVRSYCDFLARVRTADDQDGRLEQLLLAATRSVAAGRFEVWRPQAAIEQSGLGVERDCAAMPELLAAVANGELQGDGAPIRTHLAKCQTCTTTDDRTRQAEQAFAAARAAPA